MRYIALVCSGLTLSLTFERLAGPSFELEAEAGQCLRGTKWEFGSDWNRQAREGTSTIVREMTSLTNNRRLWSSPLSLLSLSAVLYLSRILWLILIAVTSIVLSSISHNTYRWLPTWQQWCISYNSALGIKVHMWVPPPARMLTRFRLYNTQWARTKRSRDPIRS